MKGRSRGEEYAGVMLAKHRTRGWEPRWRGQRAKWPWLKGRSTRAHGPQQDQKKHDNVQ